MTRLDIISDPVCPWCYIGAAHLGRALAARAPHPFAICWRPYFLNPEMPEEGMDRQSYLEAKFGGKDNAAEVYARIEAAAADAGLAVDFSRVARTPNTTDAHRVIRWAAAEDAQTRVAMELFRRYFETGADLADPDVLADAAAAAGLDRAAIARLLAGGTDRDAVRAEAAAAAEMGVTGVPTFILGGRYAVVGAQPPEVWTRVIDELAAAADGAPSR